jgi:hypothetical protein
VNPKSKEIGGKEEDLYSKSLECNAKIRRGKCGGNCLVYLMRPLFAMSLGEGKRA